MAWQPPSSAQTQAYRPLDKGMVLNQSSQVIPDGAFLQLENFIANKEGPKRSPGYAEFADGDTTPYNATDIASLWLVDGSRLTFLITEYTMWKINPLSGLTEVPWVLANDGTVTIAGTAITGTGMTWLADGILPGDLLRVGIQEGIISEVLTDTTMTLRAATITDASGQAYTVQGTFSNGVNLAMPDWVVYENELIIADGKHPLLQYNRTTETINEWVDATTKYPSSTEFVASCVGVFQDRIWVGNLYDTTDDYQYQRIRWSTLADPRDFSVLTSYLDLPYTNTPISRLVPLGNSLIAYFGDAIFVGTPTSFPTLPVRFDRYETGGMGLVGPKAITSFLGGHFFVSQDDMYLLTSQGLQHIGSPIVRQSIDNCLSPERCYATIDPQNSCVAFGFPITNDYIEKIWRYDYRSKSWAYDLMTTWMLANPLVNTTLEWDNLSGTWDALGAIYASWDSMKLLSDTRQFVIVEHSGSLWKQTEYGEYNYTTNPITATLVTKDHDFDAPDTLKTFVKFAIKIDYDIAPLVPIVFQVAVSTNRGLAWKPIGNLTIRVGYDEGYINFRAIGSTMRLRLITNTAVTSYYVSEYTLRVRGSGEELDVSTQQ